jgi:hypothetical protein
VKYLCCFLSFVGQNKNTNPLLLGYILKSKNCKKILSHIKPKTFFTASTAAASL